MLDPQILLDDRVVHLDLGSRGVVPDGAFIAVDDRAFAVRGRSLLCWAPDGYAARKPRPPSGDAEVLTPPATLAVLRAGYHPRWHDSAG